jgi:hypothetical protein
LLANLSLPVYRPHTTQRRWELPNLPTEAYKEILLSIEEFNGMPRMNKDDFQLAFTKKHLGAGGVQLMREQEWEMFNNGIYDSTH